MAIVKAHLEAVRYISAKGVFDRDETCRGIMDILSFNRSCQGFQYLTSSPYHRDGNTPRACNIANDMLAKRLGKDWYKLVVSKEGCSLILGVLRGEASSTEVDKYRETFQTDKELIEFFKFQEVLFGTRTPQRGSSAEVAEA